jgi:hypothetical protein
LHRSSVHRLLLFFLATILVSLSPLTSATLAEQASTAETPAEKQLRWALARVNDGGASLSMDRINARFAPDFLYYVPPDQLIGLFQNYLGPAGPMRIARFEGGVTETRANALLSTPNGAWRVTLETESSEPHRIENLFFEPAGAPLAMTDPPRSWGALTSRIEGLAPEVSFVAGEVVGGACVPIRSVEPEKSLAIASAFKLYVLGELARQVTAGLASWDEPLAVNSKFVSLPNGLMRQELPGTRFPLSHYAEQMISQSDNTATDHLIGRLGRENVEGAFADMGHASPYQNIPLLLTREWFAMRMRFSTAGIDRYVASDVEGRRQFLVDLVSPEADSLYEGEPWPGPLESHRIEWFASARDLCQAMAHLKTVGEQPGMEPILNALSLEPGIEFPLDPWNFVGYKGGYETGIRSDVWLLQRDDGRWFVIAAVLNNRFAENDSYSLLQLMIQTSELLRRV